MNWVLEHILVIFDHVYYCVSVGWRASEFECVSQMDETDLRNICLKAVKLKEIYFHFCGCVAEQKQSDEWRSAIVLFIFREPASISCSFTFKTFTA